MGTDGLPDLTQTEDEVLYCARHPGVETVLRCGRCETPICPRCLLQTPVGARCPTCANVSRVPTFDVKPKFLALGFIAAVVSGALAGAAWGFALGDSRLGFYFALIVAFVIGWAISEAISQATNRKRGSSLGICAIIGCAIAYMAHNAVVGEALLQQGDIWGYLTAGAAAFIAYSRLRP